MANIVKNLNGKTVLEDGKTIKEWMDEAELDPTAADNEEPMKLFVCDEEDGANFCTECGSRDIYCVREGGIAYQLVCRSCGHRPVSAPARTSMLSIRRRARRQPSSR